MSNTRTLRILLYGEGNFSFTSVLCKQLSEDKVNLHRTQYEIVSTDYASHTKDDLTEVETAIVKMLAVNQLDKKFKIVLLDGVDATKKDSRIQGQFDLVICNFPTPFGIGKFNIEELFKQIKLNNVLKPEGNIEIRFWVDDYEAKYEYSYRLAKAQKKLGFQLIKREIVDIKDLKQRGYSHILHSGEENLINELPMVATYQYTNEIKNAMLKAEKSIAQPMKSPVDEKDIQDADLLRKKVLAEEEYDEFSDSENLPNDAMPARWPNRYYGSSHSNSTLNFMGKSEPRHQKRTKVVNNDSQKLDFLKNIRGLILQKKFRKADIALTEFLEAGKQKGINPASDQSFYHYITKLIDEAYENSKLPKPSLEALRNYHQYEWYAKLKVLTGVKIPELTRKFTWQ